MVSELEDVAGETAVDPRAQRAMLALYERALGELQRCVPVRAFTHLTPAVPEDEDALSAQILEHFYATR